MKRITKSAIAVSLAMAAAAAMADNTSAFPTASDAYYRSLATSPAVTSYGNVPPPAVSSANVVAQSTYPQQSGEWHRELASVPPSYEPAEAAGTPGYDNWPQREDGPDYWTTHAPGGKPLPGTAEAAQEQQRLAQMHRYFGS
jgi:hypothetical protein